MLAVVHACLFVHSCFNYHVLYIHVLPQSTYMHTYAYLACHHKGTVVDGDVRLNRPWIHLEPSPKFLAMQRTSQHTAQHCQHVDGLTTNSASAEYALKQVFVRLWLRTSSSRPSLRRRLCHALAIECQSGRTPHFLDELHDRGVSVTLLHRA